MNCKEFEVLLAEALGDELDLASRPAFEEHLAECVACRKEWDSTRRAVADLRSLPAPHRASLNDVTSDFAPAYLAPARAAGPADRSARPGPNVGVRSVGRTLRLAASLFLAFTSGYAVHAGLTLYRTDPTRTVVGTRSAAVPGVPNTQTLEAAIARVHAQQPSRSDLAKAMIAMLPRR